MSDEIRQRLPVIVGSAQVGYAPAPDSHQTELVHRATRAALADAGVSIEEVDTVISASDDVMDGRSISSVFLVEAMGGFLKEESKVEEDGSLALFYAALRFLAGSAEMALVVASSKASECDPSWYAYTSSEPICLRPLGVDDRLAAALGAQAIVDSRGLGPDDLARLTAYHHRVARDNPHAIQRGGLEPAEVLAAPRVAGPLGQLDLPPRSDGCCVLVLASRERARAMGRPAAALTGMGTSTDSNRIGDRPLHRSRSTEQAAAAAYRMAGLDDPATAVQVAELHAPSSAHELMLAESLGLVRNGDPCRSFLDESGPRLNPSGGALGADAVFAGGLVRAAEAALQLSGRADQRQVAEARRAVSHGHSGPFLQANTVFVMERFDA